MIYTEDYEKHVEKTDSDDSINMSQKLVKLLSSRQGDGEHTV